MKNILALSVIVLGVIAGSLTAQAGNDGHGISYPEIQNTFGIDYPDSFDRSHGITYPELP